MKVQEVGAFEAKTHLSALLEKVKNGETIYITKHGKRVAELRPVESPKGERVAGTMKGMIWMSPDLMRPWKNLKNTCDEVSVGYSRFALVSRIKPSSKP